MLYKITARAVPAFFSLWTPNTESTHSLILMILSEVLLSTSWNSISTVLWRCLYSDTSLRRLVEFSTDSDRVLSPNDRPLVLQALITYCITLHRLMESYVFCVTVLEMNARLCASTFPWHPCSWIAVYLWNLWKKNQRCFKRSYNSKLYEDPTLHCSMLNGQFH